MTLKIEVMKKNYDKSVSLKCIICGDTSSFKSNHDKSWIKCERCGKVYSGGYDELKELNQRKIDEETKKMKEEISKDFKKDFANRLKDAFKGNDNIKFK